MKESKEDYKIIVPNITRKDYNWFSITKLPHYIGGDVLMIKGNTKEETLLLFAILNSEYFINFYKEKGAKKGNRIIFNQKILKDIEIPYFEEKINKKLVGLVEKMLLSNDYNYTEVIKIINKEIENI